MSKADVLSYLKKQIKVELNNGDISKQKRDFLNMLQGATEEDINFGECPNYFFAYLKCNSTGVGTSNFEGSTTRRTVAMDYTTDELLFIDGHEGAAVKGLELFDFWRIYYGSNGTLCQW